MITLRVIHEPVICVFSLRFWLIDCQNFLESARLATELYRDVIAVPFISQVVVFAKRRSVLEAQLRAYCVTDDRLDKTLETREHYREVARSRDIEVSILMREGEFPPVFIHFRSMRNMTAMHLSVGVSEIVCAMK